MMMDEGGSDSSVIKEGFICPICLRDMRSPNNLVQHFQEQHSDEQDLLKSLKELVGKAKKKILKLDDEQNDLSDSYVTLRLKRYALDNVSDVQDIGRTRTRTQYYKEIRRERLDHRTTETNKLIIRLDRLLNAPQSDRKQEEQKIVTWLDGTNVTRCPSCAAVFNIARRQHHCRLCGSIMCNSCSRFLNYDVARTIVAPVHTDMYDGETNETYQSERQRNVAKTFNNEQFRVCQHCMDMIECRRMAQLNQIEQPELCKLYYKLQKMKLQLQPSIDLYYKMHSSLTSGDKTFQLQDAQSLRGSIARQAESLDALSKRIQTLTIADDNQRVINLQNAIRRSISQYIKDNLLTLPQLPTTDELETYRRERMTRNYEQNASTTSSNASHYTTNDTIRIKKVTVTTGWSPSNVTNISNKQTYEERDVACSSSSSKSVGNVDDGYDDVVNNVGGTRYEIDPLLEQIRIVTNYIEQARVAHRYEEVVSLEENLRMLKMNYYQKK